MLLESEGYSSDWKAIVQDAKGNMLYNIVWIAIGANIKVTS